MAVAGKVLDTINELLKRGYSKTDILQRLGFKQDEAGGWVDAAKSVAPAALGLGAMGQSEESEAAFIGKLSRSFSDAAYKLAKSLEGKGASRERIWRETGEQFGAPMYRGVDGKWRQEITDEGLSITPPEYPGAPVEVTRGEQAIPMRQYRIDDAVEHENLFTAYPNMQTSRLLATGGDDVGGGASGLYSPAHDLYAMRSADLGTDEGKRIIAHEMQHGIQTRESFAPGGSATEAKEIIKELSEDADYAEMQPKFWRESNPELLRASEDARKLLTDAQVYGDAERLINYANSDQPGRSRRHIANAAQWLYEPEIRALPGAKDLERRWYDMPKRGAAKQEFLRNYAFDLAQLLKAGVNPANAASFKADPRQARSIINAASKGYSKARGDLEPLRNLERQAKRARSVYEANRFKRPHDVYEALAGEAESRLVEKRLPLTMQERIANPPFASRAYGFDVPEGEQIVRRGFAKPSMLGLAALALPAVGSAGERPLTHHKIEAAQAPWLVDVSNALRSVELPVVGRPFSNLADWAMGAAYQDEDKLSRAMSGALDVM